MREEMNQKEERSEKEILQEQLECARKQMRYSRIACIMATVMALTLVISAVFVVPSLNRAADSIAQVSGQLQFLVPGDVGIAQQSTAVLMVIGCTRSKEAVLRKEISHHLIAEVPLTGQLEHTGRN